MIEYSLFSFMQTSSSFNNMSSNIQRDPIMDLFIDPDTQAHALFVAEDSHVNAGKKFILYESTICILFRNVWKFRYGYHQ
jgi:hypothetical protein